MSRPNLVAFWNSSGNYPPGPDPWAARPLAVQPAGSFFTPNTKPAAEDFNWLFGNIVNDVQTVYQQCGLNAGQNWRTVVTATIDPHYGGAAWDTFTGQWFFGGIANDGAPGIELRVTMSAGEQTVPYGNSISLSAGLQIQSVLANLPTIVLVGVLDFVGTTTTIYGITPGTFPNWFTAVPVSSDSHDIQLDFFGGRYIGFSSKGVSANALVVSSATGLTSSWTINSTPASQNNVLKWRTAKSTTSIVAISKGETGQTKYMRSTDGMTWVERTIAIGGSGVMQGICHCIGPFGPAYVIVASTSGGTDTWISYDDGLTFSLIASAASFLAYDVAALGSLIVALNLYTLSGAVASDYVMSIDGGFTWRHVSNRIDEGIAYASRYGVDPRIYSGDIGFLSLNSQELSWSLEQGLPVHVVT